MKLRLISCPPEIIPDYPGEPSIITRVLKCGRGRSRVDVRVTGCKKIVICRQNAVQLVSKNYLSCVTEIIYLLISNSPLPPPPAPSNRYSFLSFYEFDYFRYFI